MTAQTAKDASGHAPPGHLLLILFFCNSTHPPPLIASLIGGVGVVAIDVIQIVAAEINGTNDAPPRKDWEVGGRSRKAIACRQRR